MDTGEIVISEGVALDLRPASFATRLVAAMLDLVAYAVVAVLTMLALIQLAEDLDEAGFAAAVIVWLVTLIVVVPATVETLTRGRSLGKTVMKLRIVRDDGGPIRVRHAVVRALVGVLELWLTAGGIALIASLVHPRGKRLGDRLAGTYAVRVSGALRALPPVVMPAELARWARAADIRRLPDGLALRARQFLGRAPGLHAGSRVRLGQELAGQVEAFVAPGPPAGTNPERFLAAVLAERRDREYVTAAAAARVGEQERALLARLPHGVADPEH